MMQAINIYKLITPLQCNLNSDSDRTIFTARRLCFYRCVSVHRGGGISQHALQQVSSWGWWYPSMPLQVSRPTPRGEVEGNLAGGVSRPTSKGEVEGDQAGGVSRPTPKGEVAGDLAGGVSRPTPWGCLLQWGCVGVETPLWWLLRYASYWNAFLLKCVGSFITWSHRVCGHER